MTTSLPLDHSGMGVLSRDECYDRLRTARVGRLAFVSDGDPVILPVNHGVDGESIVFRTAPGSKLLAGDSELRVAFEVDGYDVDRRSGWSVLVRGTASTVEDVGEIRREGAAFAVEIRGLAQELDQLVVDGAVGPGHPGGRQVLGGDRPDQQVAAAGGVGQPHRLPAGGQRVHRGARGQLGPAEPGEQVHPLGQMGIGVRRGRTVRSGRCRVDAGRSRRNSGIRTKG